jgi:hypothetical protein
MRSWLIVALLIPQVGGLLVVPAPFRLQARLQAPFRAPTAALQEPVIGEPIEVPTPCIEDAEAVEECVLLNAVETIRWSPSERMTLGAYPLPSPHALLSLRHTPC